MANAISEHRGHFVRWLIVLFLTASCPPVGRSQDEPLVVVQNGKYGYIDHTGKLLIQPQYIWAADFSHGFGTVYACGHYLSIDAWGTLHPLRIALPGELGVRKQGDKMGFVDQYGEFKIKPSYDEALPFSEGMAAVRIGEKWGFIDGEGKLAIDPKFENAYYFTEGVAVAELQGLGYVLIDKSGKVLASDVDGSELISDERVPFERNDKRGYVDLHGNVIISAAYDGGLGFSEGLAAVEKDEKWGYVDRTGKLVIPFAYDNAWPFGSGLAAVKIGRRTGFINKSGEFVFDLRFEGTSGFPIDAETTGTVETGTPVSSFWTDDRLFGYVDKTGHVIWGPAEESPTHPPLGGWTDELNAESCDGIPQPVKSRIADFFSQ